VDARHPELDSLARSIETRICAISSRVFYEVYYFFNPPNLLPIHEFYPMPEYDEGHPIQYTFAQAKELYYLALRRSRLESSLYMSVSTFMNMKILNFA